MSVLKVWRSLDPEQKQILLDKQVNVNRSVDEVLTLLRPLAACDALADKARTKLGCSFALAIVVTLFGSFWIAGMLGWTIGGVFVLLLVATTSVLGYFWLWTRKIDVSNNCRQFLVPVLSVFREDIDATKPMHLRIDLSSPTAKTKMQSESAPYASGIYHKVIDSKYLDPWMSAEAMLVDGTKLSWRITDSILERKKTKRNPRGKYKTKTKYKKKTDLEVKLGLRSKAYDLVNVDATVETQGKRNVVEMERTIVTMSLDPLDPRALIDLVAEVYRSAKPAQKEAGA